MNPAPLTGTVTNDLGLIPLTLTDQAYVVLTATAASISLLRNTIP